LALIVAVNLWRALAPATAAPAGDGQVRTNAFRFVDLSPFAASTEMVAARQFGVLPVGLQVFHGVPFVIRERIGVTGMESARNGEFFPTELKRIPIGSKARRLHLLHGALGADKDGVPMARLVFHYANGAEESVRLGYGIHLRNWTQLRTEKRSELVDPNSRLAWSEGDNNERTPDFRLFQTALENPRPDDVLVSLDLVSLFSRATPFIVAISVEEGESGLAPNRPLPSRKVVRELNEFSDSIYRRDLAIRVTDAQGGGALTNAMVALAVTDDHQSFYFGETRADAQGVCRLPYPPQHAVACNLLVRAPNRIPLVLSEAKTNHTELSRELTASLQRGVTAGGVVKSADGNPIAGAEVVIHKITRTGPREYTRVDFDAPVTGANGKWSSSSLPPGFDGFSFQVSHPDYRPALYAMPAQAEGMTNAGATSSSSFAQRLTQINRPTNSVAKKLPAPSPPVQYRRDPDGTMIPVRVAGEPRRPGLARPAGASFAPMLTSNALLAATAEMTLQPAILISGVVLDSEGKPMPNTEVIFQRNNPFYERKYLRTDTQGRFRMMATEPGDGTLNVLHNVPSPKYQVVNIGPGLAPIEIRLTPPRVLRGRVIDRQRRPVAGAKVRLDEWQGTADLLHFQTLTDEEGRFAWTGAPPDQVVFYVTKSNHYSMRHSLSGTSDELTLYLNRQPGVAGKVYDAETKKPIDLFTIIKGRKYSSSEQTIHWERYDTQRGRNGEYSVRVEDYYFQPEARIMVEAPGYIPQISRGFQNSDSYTNDFVLEKGKGISGVVHAADGAPAANATVVLVDKNESGYMDMSGQFRGGSSGGDMVRSDAKGRFEFSPKLEADWILVSHDQGFAEMKADKVAADGRIVLQPWGRVKGVMRVGDKPEPDQMARLQNRYDRYYEPGNRSSALSLYLKAEPDEAGNFAFEKVPPGERRIYVEYRFKERQYGETPLSHGLPLTVKPGETLDVMLGGTGRKVVGHVKVVAGEQTDVDWRRDVHKLVLSLPPEPSLKPPDMSKTTTPDAQQKAWQEFNQRQREFWKTDAGRAREQAERTYVLVFDTNGNFRVDHVPPGKYMLSITANDPEEEYYRQREIGRLSKEIEVPAVASAKVNEPFDIGTFELMIRGKLKIGKPAPPLESKLLDGKPISLTDFRGKHVLLFFWASYAGTGSYDLQVLKELHNTYGKENKLVVLGLNLDPEVQTAEQFAKNNGMVWLQAHLGEWGQTQVPASFGVDGIPAGVLIDAEGKLAARNLRGSSMRTAVRNAIAAEASAAR
jgi:peroxiredoxin